MKHIMKTTLFTSAFAAFGIVAVLSFPAMLRADADNNKLSFDVAVDCRTFVNVPERAGVSFGSGKIFPPGTLPTGTATNDPTQPVHGISPIGDWTTRGQFAFPFPASVALFYSSTPTFFATQYYILASGQTALTVEGYAYFQGQTPLASLFAVTGGIGAFRGAAGDLQGTALGTNATGCPNFRATFNIQPGSVRGTSSH
ncbi:MAG TPA: hypothetical protein VE621_13595 [Bryobacteraceae bacterium]|jgi:hypothetical protein|nr:hypothetical protein [Bryobacteraceae bacterium]